MSADTKPDAWHFVLSMQDDDMARPDLHMYYNLTSARRGKAGRYSRRHNYNRQDLTPLVNFARIIGVNMTKGLTLDFSQPFLHVDNNGDVYALGYSTKKEVVRMSQTLDVEKFKSYETQTFGKVWCSKDIDPANYLFV